MLTRYDKLFPVGKRMVARKVVAILEKDPGTDAYDLALGVNKPPEFVQSILDQLIGKGMVRVGIGRNMPAFPAVTWLGDNADEKSGQSIS